MRREKDKLEKSLKNDEKNVNWNKVKIRVGRERGKNEKKKREGEMSGKESLGE